MEDLVGINGTPASSRPAPGTATSKPADNLGAPSHCANAGGRGQARDDWEIAGPHRERDDTKRAKPRSSRSSFAPNPVAFHGAELNGISQFLAA
jgi:hypothetical protein